MSEFTEQQEILYAAEEARKKAARERRRSSLSLPTVSDLQDTLSASVNIGSDQVEFEAQGVKINRDGLFIEGTNVSEVHQDDLSVLGELGRGACSVVMQAQVNKRMILNFKQLVVFWGGGLLCHMVFLSEAPLGILYECSVERYLRCRFGTKEKVTKLCCKHVEDGATCARVSPCSFVTRRYCLS